MISGASSRRQANLIFPLAKTRMRVVARTRHYYSIHDTAFSTYHRPGAPSEALRHSANCHPIGNACRDSREYLNIKKTVLRSRAVTRAGRYISDQLCGVPVAELAYLAGCTSRSLWSRARDN